MALWQRAWALTALGRFGEALTMLDRCADLPEAWVTRGALLRQIGLHQRAEPADRRALAAAGDGPAAAAARISLVADEVGQGADHDELHRRLDAAASALERHPDWRQSVRLGWVTGEVDVVTGRMAAAEAAFSAAAAEAARHGARRHEAKSHGFLAAVLGLTGRRSAAVETAAGALVAAQQMGARPLQWALHLVLADHTDAAHHRARARELIAAALEGLPAALAAEARTRPPAAAVLSE
ncbi:MAG TPA: hypothetical protein VM307_02740 [Egibacteraceae bacterium]|nr:hypothetical protein [Egibacteraceae bacterium]